MKQHEIVFLPSETRGRVPDSSTLREAAWRLGEGIESVCGGKGACGKCRVKIIEGRANGIDSRLDHLSPMTGSEKLLFERQGLQRGERLSCQAKIHGDVVVFVPEENRIVWNTVFKSAGKRSFDIDPAISKRYVEFSPKESIQPADITGSAFVKLIEISGLSNLIINDYALKSFKSSAIDGATGVTFTIWDDREIIRIEPGNKEKSYGIAIDIGTTTLGGYLCDLTNGAVIASESMLNPQIGFGTDIMARIAYTKGDANGLQKLNTCVTDAVNELVESVTSQANLVAEDVVEAVIVGNTVMHHVLHNYPITSLGAWPFIPVTRNSVNRKAEEVGIAILPSANVHTLPIEAAFVGADNVAVLIAEEPYSHTEVALIVDIGTNGELVLGNQNRILSASCATGPAFEGANITFGMRAVPGAINRVRIDPESYYVTFSVVGESGWNIDVDRRKTQARGICGSGIIDAVAEMLVAGILKKDGAFDKTIRSRNLRMGIDGKPEFVIAQSAETSIGQDIVITQKDIRAVQLAKAAIFSGIRLLLNRFGLENPEKVVLAGAFGTMIDRLRAQTIGMFPQVGKDRIYAVGNAAGDGAIIALLNRNKRIEAEKIAREVEYVELTEEPGFEEAFIAATHFPETARESA